MANGVMQIATIARTQDYTSMKHNENARNAVDQTNFNQSFSKEIEHKTKEVVKSEESRQEQKKFDAKEKGNGNYQGRQQKKEKKDTVHDKIEPKKMGGFDMKV